jgi:hypothetical protein
MDSPNSLEALPPSKLIFDSKTGNNEKIAIEGGMGGTKGS